MVIAANMVTYTACVYTPCFAYLYRRDRQHLETTMSDINKPASEASHLCLTWSLYYFGWFDCKCLQVEVAAFGNSQIRMGVKASIPSFSLKHQRAGPYSFLFCAEQNSKHSWITPTNSLTSIALLKLYEALLVRR